MPVDTSEVAAKLSAYRNESKANLATLAEPAFSQVSPQVDDGNASDTDSAVHSI